MLARIVAGSLDVGVVQLPEVLVEPALRPRGARAVGMVGQELPGSFDLVGQRDVGQRLGADQVVEELVDRGRNGGRSAHS